MKNKKNIFDYLNYFILTLFSFSMVYPFIYLISTSISDKQSIAQGLTKFYPKGINFYAYSVVFSEPKLWTAYMNSAIYAVSASVVMIIITAMVAYPLTQQRMKYKKAISLYYIMTMFLSGGMIPTYLLYRSLGLVDNMLVMILPGALGVFNLMMFRTYFTKSIGFELIESAYIDGARDFYILFKIMIPLSKPIIAALSLFMFVGVWNNFFTPLMYLQNEKLQPLTILLRRLLIQVDYRNLEVQKIMDLSTVDELKRKQALPLQAFRAAAIMVAIFPITIIYPFLQKYFVKGVMIGSLKG
jgi:putative aldouronate transport system permease protein